MAAIFHLNATLTTFIGLEQLFEVVNGGQCHGAAGKIDGQALEHGLPGFDDGAYFLSTHFQAAGVFILAEHTVDHNHGAFADFVAAGRVLLGKNGDVNAGTVIVNTHYTHYAATGFDGANVEHQAGNDLYTS